MSVYKHNRLPALGWNAEREVVDEFRRVERWSVEVQYEMARRPPWGEFCPSSDGAIPYLDCESGLVQPSPMVYRPDYVITAGNPAITVDATLAFPFDRLLAFANEAGTEWLGGIGNFAEAPDVLIFAATADPANWSNTATRRPIAMGGSHVAIDAGSSMALALPGIVANDYGYDLQIGADGQSVLAVANPPPDGEWHDTSQSNLDNLDSFTWEVFPNTGANATDRLEVTLLAGTEAGTADVRAAVRVVETSGARSGTCTLGFGINGATPLAEDAQTFTIPAGFTGVLNFTKDFAMASDLTANAVLTFWYSITEEQSQFNLLTDSSLADHTLDVTISYGGGGGTPTIPNHNALPNVNVLSGGHTADVLNYDNVSSGLAANTVQAAIDEVAASSGGGPTGWGGLVLDFTQNGGQAGDITLPANNVWASVNINGKVTFMPNDSGVLLTSAGTIWMQAATPPNRLTVHALINIDAPGVVVNRDSWVKLRIAVTPDGVSDFTTVGGESRSQWVDAGTLVDQGCTLSASAVVGSPAVGSKYYIQMTNTSNSAVVCKIRAMSFWLEYS